MLGASADTTCALLGDQSVECVGRYAADGGSAFTQIGLERRQLSGSPSPGHLCALPEDEEVGCGGANTLGQRGVDRSTYESFDPVLVRGL